MTTIQLGDVTLTRVLYLEAADPDAGGLTPDEVRAVPWGEPTRADDGSMRLASCAWVVSAGGRHLVIDPSGQRVRTGAELGRCAGEVA